ncbi:MAG: DUF4956 domain-containing protein [Eubacterium sp.]|nr:DUF4956 domain-containing protein [Eubacterium sp.]
MKQYLYDTLMLESGTLTIQTVIMNFIAAGIVGILIFISYRISHSGAVYSRKFNVSLIMLTLITTLVMSVIGNNIALSLGMVGALSIVRFRTVIKDPRDTAYIFWCIAAGICCGVSDYMIAGIGTFVIFLFLLLFGAVADNDRIMVVIKSDPAILEEIHKEVIAYFDGAAVLKMENLSKEKDRAETIFEISDRILEKAESKKGPLSVAFTDRDGVYSVSLVRQDEEINL